MAKLVRFAWIIGIGIILSVGLTLLALNQSSTATPLPKPTPTAKAPAQPTAAQINKLSGIVVDAAGPVAGATVRVHLTEKQTTSAPDGSFTLDELHATDTVTITAWAEGYYINWTRVTAANEPIQLQLSHVYTTDNVAYDWFEQEGVEGSAACGVCHTAYTEWQQDAHAQTAINYRFVTMYAGTDIHGNQSPQTGYTRAGKIAPPDLSQPYYGPGFKLDNPNRPGSCAACHTPMAAKIETSDGCSWSGCHSSATAEYTDLIAAGASPLYLYGDSEEGISCEFCHKIENVRINPATGTPYDDAPGILSLELRRPEAGADVFFGPLDDVVRTDLETPRDSYLPLQQESVFCAGCHHGVMGGVVADMKVTGGVLVYSSYAEWLASPYSDPKTGKSCQDCHMPAQQASHFVFPEKGGQQRDHYLVSNHQMPGTHDEQLLRNAVTMTSTAIITGSQVQVAVSITNDQTGHAVPTDSPLRHLLLVVKATDANGKPLALQMGSTLPDWAGNYAGVPGAYYAKILRDKWTGEAPTAAYWRDIELVEDVRIMPLASALSEYTFQAPKGAATIEVQLIYRRAYQQVIEWKDWPDPDVVMEQTKITVKEQP